MKVIFASKIRIRIPSLQERDEQSVPLPAGREWPIAGLAALVTGGSEEHRSVRGAQKCLGAGSVWAGKAKGSLQAHQGRVLSARNASGLVLPESHYFTTSSDCDLYVRISDCFSGRVV